MRTTDRPFPPQLALLTGVLAAATASVFIRLAQGEASALAVAAWRLMLATLILAPFALARRREELSRLTRREWALALGSGLLLAVHFATWIGSLYLTSVAASVVLVSTSPLWVAVGSHLFLRERMNRWTVTGLAIALVGSTVIGMGDAGSGRHQLGGDALALAGALSVAGYFLIGRRLRARLSLLGYVFPVYGTAALALLAGATVGRVAMSGYSALTWASLLLLALLPQIVGHSSLNYALRHLTATYVTLAVLGEPIGSTLLAWALLGESPTLPTLVGGALILAGIVVAGRSPAAPS